MTQLTHWKRSSAPPCGMKASASARALSAPCHGPYPRPDPTSPQPPGDRSFQRSETSAATALRGGLSDDVDDDVEKIRRLLSSQTRIPQRFKHFPPPLRQTVGGMRGRRLVWVNYHRRSIRRGHHTDNDPRPHRHTYTLTHSLTTAIPARTNTKGGWVRIWCGIKV